MGPGPAEFPWPATARAALSITFDDTRTSQVDVGVDVLDAHRLKASFYAVPALVERRREAWVEVAARGHELGNHSVTHPCSGHHPFSRENALEGYTLARIEADLMACEEQLERLLGVTTTSFAYPCSETTVGRGPTAQSYIPVVARNFEFGRSGGNLWANDPSVVDLANIASTTIDGMSWEGVRERVDATIEQGRWLVLVAHDVGDAGWQSLASTTLDELCRYAVEKSDVLWTDTVTAVGRHVRACRSTTRETVPADRS